MGAALRLNVYTVSKTNATHKQDVNLCILKMLMQTTFEHFLFVLSDRFLCEPHKIQNNP